METVKFAEIKRRQRRMLCRHNWQQQHTQVREEPKRVTLKSPVTVTDPRMPCATFGSERKAFSVDTQSLEAVQTVKLPTKILQQCVECLHNGLEDAINDYMMTESQTQLNYAKKVQEQRQNPLAQFF